MRTIIITSGGTSEKIDNVRKITNSSSGRLGCRIAEELIKRENDLKIYYICNKWAIKPSHSNIKIIEIESVQELQETIEKLLANYKIDYFVHSMAVSDYTKDTVTTIEEFRDSIITGKQLKQLSDNKISSNKNNLVIILKPTSKIISLIKRISPQTFLVGFKLLDGVSKEELIDVAIKLRDKNQCDLVVANDLEKIRSGNHTAYIIDKAGEILEATKKEEIAKKLVYKMFQ